MKGAINHLAVTSTGIRMTRMELLTLKRRKALADRGRELLEEKLDALIMEFFEFIREIETLRSQVQKTLGEAYGIFTDAQVVIGTRKLRQVALTSTYDRFDIEAKTRNVMGIAIPVFQLTETTSVKPIQRYSAVDTSAKLDEAVLKIGEVLRTVIVLAETEAAVRRLAEVITFTKRRVNCLKYVFIPKIDSTIRFIEMHLAEREREDFFRLKRVKAKLERAEKEVEPIHALVA